MILLNLINFLAAFLLFQIELIVAKMLLPLYGGSYMVWGACVVFFQAALLAGYVFVHWAAARAPAKYFRWNIVLLFVPLLTFPGRSLVISNPDSSAIPVLDIFLQLLMTIGPVFFILATTSVHFQRWMVSSWFRGKYNPYPLYAYSNFGSFAALLSYPFFFEYFFDLTVQRNVWRVLYACFFGMSVAAYFKFIRQGDPNEKRQQEEEEVIPKEEVVHWFILGMAGSMLFLSVTNILTYTVAPVPLLWVVPLAIYLLSFVLNFKEKIWCPGWITGGIPVFLALGVIMFFLVNKAVFPESLDLAILCFLLFVLCMYCQNQLIRHKARTKNGLTQFYVMISLGSFIGGLAVTWIIPLVSTTVIEFPLSLFLVALTFVISGGRKEQTHIRISDAFLMFLVMVCLALWPVVYPRYHMPGYLFFAVVICVLFARLHRRRMAIVLTMALLLSLLPLLEVFWNNFKQIVRIRNYYGVYNIEMKKESRSMSHGKIIHGLQVTAPALRKQVIGYYGEPSGFGQVINSELFEFKKIAGVGLGIGSIAGYVGPGREMDYMELDPDVYKIATKYFTYLADAEGRVTCAIGDGRKILEQSDRRYDLIVADAFGGDAIPFHLITVEMLEIYRDRLADDGIVMFHLTNRFFNLLPVLAANAHEVGAKCYYKFTLGGGLHYATVWMGVVWDEESQRKFAEDLKWYETAYENVRGFRPWTDDYSSVIKIIQLERLRRLLVEFEYFSF